MTAINKASTVNVSEGTRLFEALKTSATITKISFYNLNAYTVSLQKYIKNSAGGLTIIFTYQLNGGDTVHDFGPYHLEPGDFLFATSTVSGTQFTIEGTKE